jgi:dihydropteroate synthase
MPASPRWRFIWGSRGPVWTQEEGTRLLGVVNVTPDSFSDGGRYRSPRAARAHAMELVAQGADALDVGAESTRPGHTPVPPREEWDRLAPALEAILASVSVPVSVDTRHAWVAARALAMGALAVNDVSGLEDEAMARVVASMGASIVVGDFQPGEPQDPQAVRRRLLARARLLQEMGVPPQRISLDPGLGFAKRPPHSWRLLRDLASLVDTGYAITVGASRKGFVTQAAQSQELDDRDQVTSVVTFYAATQGVAMVRVHAPLPSRRALRVHAALAAESPDPPEEVAHP